MASREQTRMQTAISNCEDGGACALACCVKIALAFDAALSAGVFAMSAFWGLARPAAGCAVAFLVSVFMVWGV